MRDGTPAADVDGALGDFLTQLDGSYKYEWSPPVRCDNCSEVIHPHKDATLWLSDKTIDRVGSDESGFETVRLECGECSVDKLIFPATGYTELLLRVEFDKQHIYRNIHLIDVSGSNNGIKWSPVDLRDYLFPHQGDEKAIYGNCSPSDMMRIIADHIDPRELIDVDTGQIIPGEEEQEVVGLYLGYQMSQDESDKDDLKALQQSAEGDDVTLDEIRRYEDRLKKDIEQQLGGDWGPLN